jgi:hypothetical protein
MEPTPAPFERNYVIEEPDWARNPLWYRDTDQGRLYTIAALAHALNRSPISIRKWEDAGRFPRTTLIGPRGIRLYPYEVVLALVMLAKRSGMLDSEKTPTKQLAWFSKAAHSLFKEARIHEATSPNH